MTSIREQIVDLIFSLSDEQLEQLRELINTNTELEVYSKEVMNKVIDNAHKNMRLEEMKEILMGVGDAYDGFIAAVLNYVDKSNERLEVVSEYLIEHPKALSSDILEFISGQEDFYDDAIEQYVKSGNIRELHEKLRDIPDSCPAFVGEVIRYAATDKSRKEKVLKFMREHPDAKSADVSKFVMEQEDFHEAAKFTLRE